MRLTRFAVENFRLLRNITVGVEDRTTLIVGRNNAGKTSVAELFRRLLNDKTPSFRIEDFSLGCHEQFWDAYVRFKAGDASTEVAAALPSIRVTLDIDYDINAADLGPLSDCIIDLNPDCHSARVVLTYGPAPTAPSGLFADVVWGEDPLANRQALFRALPPRVPAAYAAALEAVDPNDPTNRKALELKTLTTLVRGGFINAHRGLDDDTHRERDVLGKVIEVLFQSALTDPVDPARRTTAEELKAAVETIQDRLHADFNAKVTSLLGRGWNKYNFGQMLEWFQVGPPADKVESFESNRNLFYVACSRPKSRLAVLFTQLLCAEALGQLTDWFGPENVIPLPSDPIAPLVE